MPFGSSGGSPDGYSDPELPPQMVSSFLLGPCPPVGRVPQCQTGPPLALKLAKHLGRTLTLSLQLWFNGLSKPEFLYKELPSIFKRKTNN